MKVYNNIYYTALCIACFVTSLYDGGKNKLLESKDPHPKVLRSAEKESKDPHPNVLRPAKKRKKSEDPHPKVLRSAEKESEDPHPEVSRPAKKKKKDPYDSLEDSEFRAKLFSRMQKMRKERILELEKFKSGISLISSLAEEHSQLMALHNLCNESLTKLKEIMPKTKLTEFESIMFNYRHIIEFIEHLASTLDESLNCKSHIDKTLQLRKLDASLELMQKYIATFIDFSYKNHIRTAREILITLQE